MVGVEEQAIVTHIQEDKNEKSDEVGSEIDGYRRVGGCNYTC